MLTLKAEYDVRMEELRIKRIQAERERIEWENEHRANEQRLGNVCRLGWFLVFGKTKSPSGRSLSF